LAWEGESLRNWSAGRPLDSSWQVAHGSLAGFRIQETAGVALQVGEMGAEPPVGLCGQMG
jgi:hypothetical protein